jgi:hypothetical protein
MHTSHDVVALLSLIMHYFFSLLQLNQQRVLLVGKYLFGSEITKQQRAIFSLFLWFPSQQNHLFSLGFTIFAYSPRCLTIFLPDDNCEAGTS